MARFSSHACAVVHESYPALSNNSGFSTRLKNASLASLSHASSPEHGRGESVPTIMARVLTACRTSELLAYKLRARPNIFSRAHVLTSRVFTNGIDSHARLGLSKAAAGNWLMISIYAIYQ